MDVHTRVRTATMLSGSLARLTARRVPTTIPEVSGSSPSTRSTTAPRIAGSRTTKPKTATSRAMSGMIENST